LAGAERGNPWKLYPKEKGNIPNRGRRGLSRPSLVNYQKLSPLGRNFLELFFLPRSLLLRIREKEKIIAQEGGKSTSLSGKIVYHCKRRVGGDLLLTTPTQAFLFVKRIKNINSPLLLGRLPKKKREPAVGEEKRTDSSYVLRRNTFLRTRSYNGGGALLEKRLFTLSVNNLLMLAGGRLHLSREKG